MLIKEIILALEAWAPPAYQESYDNCGLITGSDQWNCTGAICTLDATEEVIDEAIENKCNLVLAHHPIVFSGLKKLSGNSYMERAIIKAIKKDIAIYAIHTNLDNINTGVNYKMANALGLKNTTILLPKAQNICKLYTYVPITEAEMVKNALFEAGAGQIENYSECSFSTKGNGSFRPMAGSNPVVGTTGGPREMVEEVKLEMVFPAYLQSKIVKALHQAHSYEVPAYEVILLQNVNQTVGSGLIGELPKTINENEFLTHLKQSFGLKLIKHTAFLNKPIRTVAICGGSGSFLTSKAIGLGADAFITSDIKYHEFFDADKRILLADIGHWESEQYTIDLLNEFLQLKFPTFAVLKSGTITNPVSYFIGN